MPPINKDLENQDPLNILVLQKLRVLIQSAHNHSDMIRKKCGIGGTQLWLLQEINDNPNIRVGMLAKKVSLKSTTVSNLIDDLDDKYLIKKIRVKTDQRAVHLDITDKGLGILKSAPKPTKGLLPDALENMKKADLNRLAKTLDTLIVKINGGDECLGKQPLPFNV